MAEVPQSTSVDARALLEAQYDREAMTLSLDDMSKGMSGDVRLKMESFLLEMGEPGKLALPDMQIKCQLEQKTTAQEKYPPRQHSQASIAHDRIARRLHATHGTNVAMSASTARLLICMCRPGVGEHEFAIPFSVTSEVKDGRMRTSVWLHKALPPTHHTELSTLHTFAKYVLRAQLVKHARQAHMENRLKQKKGTGDEEQPSTPCERDPDGDAPPPTLPATQTTSGVDASDESDDDANLVIDADGGDDETHRVTHEEPPKRARKLPVRSSARGPEAKGTEESKPKSIPSTPKASPSVAASAFNLESVLKNMRAIDGVAAAIDDDEGEEKEKEKAVQAPRTRLHGMVESADDFASLRMPDPPFASIAPTSHRYAVFRLGDNAEATTDHNVHRLLIRSKLDARRHTFVEKQIANVNASTLAQHTRSGGAAQHLSSSLLPKIDYLPEFGAETLTHDEILWHYLTQCLQCADEHIIGRVHYGTMHLLAVKRYTNKEWGQAFQQDPVLASRLSTCLARFDALLTELRQLPVGQYLLLRAEPNPHELRILQSTQPQDDVDEATRSTTTLFDTSSVYSAMVNPKLYECATRQAPRKYNEIDPHTLLAWHRVQSRMPSTFPPRAELSVAANLYDDGAKPLSKMQRQKLRRKRLAEQLTDGIHAASAAIGKSASADVSFAIDADEEVVEAKKAPPKKRAKKQRDYVDMDAPEE